MNTFIQSFIIGLAIAAPVGPIGVLCIQRTLAQGTLHGFVSGMGAATADALYGCMIAFGLAALSGFLLGISDVLSIAGGFFLIYLGVRTLFFSAAPDVTSHHIKTYHGLLHDYLTTLMLTLANPLTMLAFIGIFAGIGRDMTASDASVTWLIVSGVFLGSAAWWLTLSGSVGLLRTRIRPHLLIWVNRLSGGVIILFAVRILLTMSCCG